MYGFEGLGLSEVQLSISELSVVGGWWVTRQTHFMVGPSQGPTKMSGYKVTVPKALQDQRMLILNQFLC